MARRLGAMVLAGLLVASAPALADDIVATHATGTSDATLADARTAALDSSFAVALKELLGQLVTPADRAAHKADIDREIVARPRIWVASFKVVSDDTTAGRRMLDVDIKLAASKVIARLTELGVPVHAEAISATAGPGPGPSATPAPGSKAATLLLRVSDATGLHATFGATGSRDVVGAAAARTALERAGLRAVPASAAGPAVDKEGDVPLDAAQAQALAQDSKAQLAIVIGLTLGAPSAVRGTGEQVQRRAIHVRVVDVGSRAEVGRVDRVDGAIIASAGGAASVDDFVASAVKAALPMSREVAPALLPGEASGDGILIVVGGGAPFARVFEARQLLGKLKDVRAVAVRRLGPTGWVLQIVGAATARAVADKLRTMTPAPTVKLDGGSVRISFPVGTV